MLENVIYKKFHSWLNKQPILKNSSQSISPYGGVEIDSSFATQNKSSGARVHLKETLKKNKLFYQSKNQKSFSECHFFIDNSLSVFEFISKKDLSELIDFFKQWFLRSNITLRIHYLDSNKPAQVWGEESWANWKGIGFRPDSVSVIISDFHGSSPNGMFWKNCASRSFPILLWLRHDKPKFKDSEVVSDIENLNKLCEWKRDVFTQEFIDWEKNTKQFLRKYSGVNKECHDVEELILFLLKQFTD